MQTTFTKDRKAQIKEVAQNLFRERGYAATSMRDLARQVGIEPASLYSHITSKESILREICFRMADEFFEVMDQIRVLPVSPPERLQKAIVAHMGVIRNNFDAATVFFHEWRFLEEPNLSRFKTMRKTYEYQFREILEEGIQTGHFREVDVKVVLPTLFSAMNWAHEYVKPSSQLPSSELGKSIYQLFFEGLKKA